MIQFIFFVMIMKGIVTLDIDSATVQMIVNYLNDVAIFTHLERKRERGMIKWIDQSALDAAINRRRNFPLFRHFASRLAPTWTHSAGHVSPFIFSLTVITSPTLCGGHPRARRFSARKAEADGARAAAVVTKADQITTGAGIKARGKKKRQRLRCHAKRHIRGFASHRYVLYV